MEEARAAVKRMKSGRAVAQDDIPEEVWRCLGERTVEQLVCIGEVYL